MMVCSQEDLMKGLIDLLRFMAFKKSPVCTGLFLKCKNYLLKLNSNEVLSCLKISTFIL